MGPYRIDWGLAGHMDCETLVEARSLLGLYQAEFGEGEVQVYCMIHGWQYTTTEGFCVECDAEDYQDYVETRSDALGFCYP